MAQIRLEDVTRAYDPLSWMERRADPRRAALAAVLLRPAEREVARRVDLPLPGLRLRDAPRVAELDRTLVALALRHVLLEPGAHLALERELLRRVREIHGRGR